MTPLTTRLRTAGMRAVAATAIATAALGASVALSTPAHADTTTNVTSFVAPVLGATDQWEYLISAEVPALKLPGAEATATKYVARIQCSDGDSWAFTPTLLSYGVLSWSLNSRLTDGNAAGRPLRSEGGRPCTVSVDSPARSEMFAVDHEDGSWHVAPYYDVYGRVAGTDYGRKVVLKPYLHVSSAPGGSY